MEHFVVYITENPNDQLGGNAYQYAIGITGRGKSWVTPTAGTLKKAFEDAGWIIQQLTVKWAENFREAEQDFQTDAYNATISIIARVFSNFSEQEVANGAAGVMSQYFDVYAVNAKRGVESTINIVKSTGSNNTTNTGGNNNGGNNSGGNNKTIIPNEKGFADYISEFFKSLGGGLGVSTPIVAGSLLILAVVLIKNK